MSIAICMLKALTPSAANLTRLRKADALRRVMVQEARYSNSLAEQGMETSRMSQIQRKRIPFEKSHVYMRTL